MLNDERMIVEGKKVLRWPDQAPLIEVSSTTTTSRRAQSIIGAVAGSTVWR